MVVSCALVLAIEIANIYAGEWDDPEDADRFFFDQSSVHHVINKGFSLVRCGASLLIDLSAFIRVILIHRAALRVMRAA